MTKISRIILKEEILKYKKHFVKNVSYWKHTHMYFVCVF